MNHCCRGSLLQKNCTACSNKFTVHVPDVPWAKKRKQPLLPDTVTPTQTPLAPQCRSTASVRRHWRVLSSGCCPCHYHGTSKPFHQVAGPQIESNNSGGTKGHASRPPLPVTRTMAGKSRHPIPPPSVQLTSPLVPSGKLWVQVH